MELQKDQKIKEVLSDEFLKNYEYDNAAYSNYENLFETHGRNAKLVYKMVCYIMFDTLVTETGVVFDDKLREYVADVCIDAYLQDKSNMLDLSFLAYFVGQQVINGVYTAESLSEFSTKTLLDTAFHLISGEPDKTKL